MIKYECRLAVNISLINIKEDKFITTSGQAFHTIATFVKVNKVSVSILIAVSHSLLLPLYMSLTAACPIADSLN